MAGARTAPVFLTFSFVYVTIYTMPFCHAPWTNVDISPQGDILPCCKYNPGPGDPKFNIQSHSLTEYSESAFLREIQQEFSDDQWPEGCVRCQLDEQNNISSKRQLDHERWKEHYDHYDFDSNQWITASIAFGNTCNLKCITCDSDNSSRWREEYRDIYGKDFQHVKFYRNDFVDDFVAQSPKILHLDIPGGEPFLSGVAEQKKLLQHYIDSDQARDISIHYTTNVTVFPDAEWWQLWSHFREIDMQLSIDGVGARYEYIRHPANWSILVDNVNQYLLAKDPHIRLSVSHTVSAYNIYYLDEFFKWCYTIGLPRPWLGRVHTPQHMRPGVWSQDARLAIIEKLQTSQYPDVLTWANMISTVDESKFFNEFKNKLHAHDQYRGVNFKNTFPELANYI
jgi:MoaA/NifB/PqqE/SkfB family radical SAM enzyme